jgi:hypothetical protein
MVVFIGAIYNFSLVPLATVSNVKKIQSVIAEIFHCSSSIWGCLFLVNFLFWFGPQSLSLEFEEDPISGCWDIPLLIKVGGRLAGWLGGWLAGWLGGWLSDYTATLWPILQEETCQIFS